jgi:hypothetical protein
MMTCGSHVPPPLLVRGLTHHYRWNKKIGGSGVVPPPLPPCAVLSVTHTCKNGNPHTNFWLYFLIFLQICFSLYCFLILSLHNWFGWSDRGWFDEKIDYVFKGVWRLCQWSVAREAIMDDLGRRGVIVGVVINGGN